MDFNVYKGESIIHRNIHEIGSITFVRHTNLAQDKKYKNAKCKVKSCKGKENRSQETSSNAHPASLANVIAIFPLSFFLFVDIDMFSGT